MAETATCDPTPTDLARQGEHLREQLADLTARLDGTALKGKRLWRRVGWALTVAEREIGRANLLLDEAEWRRERGE
jgi:hypothetical protein